MKARYTRSRSHSLYSIACLTAALCMACGSEGSSTNGSTDDPNGAGNGGPGTGDPNDPNGNNGGSTTATDLVGVWKVTGKDSRGTYAGQAEVRAAGNTIKVIRTIRYDTVKVEDGRDLHWAFIGTAKGDTKKEITVDVVLENRDFVIAHGGIERKATDAPIAVTGKIRLEAGKVSGKWAGTGVDGDETWDAPASVGAKPIIEIERTIVAGHDAPSTLVKTGFFATYSSYHSLPVITPYVSRPEFQAAIHGHVVDKTDFAFYRANKNALRVINKSIDAISLVETKSRANAFRFTLAEKAAGFDEEIAGEFIHPTTGMLLDGAPAGQPKQVHMSAALWTGTYLASQVYRFQVTGDPKAKANVIATLDGMLKLQEVTGDWSQFARAIRPATGSATGEWHTGAGALSNLEWLEGGNTDMMKGVYIAYALGYGLLCKAPGQEALCNRIRTNAKHLSDDVNVDRGSDELDSAWLTTIVTNDLVTKLTYQAKAEAAWLVSKPVMEANTTLYEQGTADWSGLNLGFVGSIFHMELAAGYNVGGNGGATIRGIIEDSWQHGLRRQRLPLWNLLQAAYGTSPKDPAAADDITWRLREMPFPKPMVAVDHRIRPNFCLSPYPSLPWKNDWTTTDRTQALNSAPLFEEAMDLYRFRNGLKYSGDTRAARPPAPDFLIAYWFGRKHGLIAAGD